MSSHFDRALPRSADRSLHYYKPEDQTSWRDKDARDDRRERAAANARKGTRK